MATSEARRARRAEARAIYELRSQGCTCKRPAVIVVGTESNGAPRFSSGHDDDCALLKAAR